MTQKLCDGCEDLAARQCPMFRNWLKAGKLLDQMKDGQMLIKKNGQFIFNDNTEGFNSVLHVGETAGEALEKGISMVSP